MYINKTSRRIIFLNAAFLAALVFLFTEKFYQNSVLFNLIFSLYVFSASVLFESLRYLKNKKKLKKMFKIIKDEPCLVDKLEPCMDEVEMMEETLETDRM